MRKFKHKKTGNIYIQDGNYYISGNSKLPYWVVVESNDWQEIKQAPKIGTKVRVTNTVSGCFVAEGKIGIVTDKLPDSGILEETLYVDDLEVFNIDVNGYVYRVACINWQEIQEIPVGTKVVDTYPETGGYTYTKQESGKWKLNSIDNFTISESSIGEGKRFQIVEEVKKDWEILSFISNEKCIVTKEDNYYSGYVHLQLGYLLDNWKVHSIKRLSDNEVFQIGDKIDQEEQICKNSVIESFNFDKKGNILVWVHNNKPEFRVGLELSTINKSKPILFTTEDGIDFYEHGILFYVQYFTIGNCHSDSAFYHRSKENIKLFSRKEAAENWIICNKPCLSFNDIWNCSNNKDSKNKWLVVSKNQLKELVKNKL